MKFFWNISFFCLNYLGIGLHMFGNFCAMAAFLVLACIRIINMNWFGLIGVAGAIIAMPIFFCYKNLPQSKLYMWRIIRLVAAIIVVLGVEILQLVG